MKKILLLLVLLLSVYTVAGEDAGAFQELQHAILVNVNSRKITRKQLDDMGLLLFRINFPDRPLEEVTEKEISALSASALRELVVMNLVEDEAETVNSNGDSATEIRISSEDVTGQVERLGLMKFIGKPLTMRFAKSQIMMEMILSKHGMSVSSSPREIINFYKKYRDDIFVTRRMIQVRHLFLATDTITPEVTKKQAAMLYDELVKMPVEKRMILFPKMVKDFSQDRFRDKGGLLELGDGGWFPQDHSFILPNGKAIFPEGMLRGIRSLTGKGDVKLSKSSSGWHILMLENAKGGVVIPISKARPFIENFLSQRKADLFKANWLGGKVDRSNVIWNDGDKFPRDKIIMQPGEEQGLEFLRMRILRTFDKSSR